MNTLDIVNNYFDSLSNKQGEGITDMVTEDVTFTGPFFKANGKDEFITGIQKWIQLKKSYAMKKQLVSDNDTCSLYEVTVTSPTGVTLTIRMTDWITIRDGKIVGEQVFFDPTEWVKAMRK